MFQNWFCGEARPKESSLVNDGSSLVTVLPPYVEDLLDQHSLLAPWAGISPVAMWQSPLGVFAGLVSEGAVSSESELPLWMAFPLWSPACGSLAEALSWSAANGVQHIFILVGCERGLRFGRIDCPVSDRVSPQTVLDSTGIVNWLRGANMTVAAVCHAFAGACQSYLTSRAFGQYCAAVARANAAALSAVNGSAFDEHLGVAIQAQIFAAIDAVLANAGWQSDKFGSLPIGLAQWCSSATMGAPKRNRREVITALPIGIAKSLMANDRNAAADVQRFTAAVDAGVDIGEALSQWLRCSPGVAKTILRRRQVLPAKISAARMQRVLSLLDAVHDGALLPKHMPTSRAEWSRLDRVRGLVDRDAPSTVNGVRFSRYEWIAVAALRRYSPGDQRIVVAVKALIDVVDALQAFYDSLDAKGGLDAPDATNTRARLLGLGFRDLSAMANQVLIGRMELPAHHLQRVLEDAADPDLSDAVAPYGSWINWMWAKAPPPADVSLSGVSLTPIRTLEELQVHAIDFQNCLRQPLLQPERTFRSRWFYVLDVRDDSGAVHHALASVLVDKAPSASEGIAAAVVAELDQVEGAGGAECAPLVHEACCALVAFLNGAEQESARAAMDEVAEEIGYAVVLFAMLWREFNLRKLLGDPLPIRR